MRRRPNFEFLDNGGEPIAFAHRGGNAAGTEKENTMAAFQAAYDLGYRYFETDVIRSLDRKVVAIHGSASHKESEKTGLPLRKRLEQEVYEHIKRTEIGGEPIPLLEEVMSTFPDVRFNIDPKTDKVVEPLGILLDRMNAADRVCIGSFKYERTKAVANMLGGQNKLCTSVGPLGFVALKTGLGPLIDRTDAACFQIPHTQTTAKMIERAHDHGLDVHVWTVNDEPSMQRMLDNGVDGIMSDEVTLLKEVIRDKI